MSAYSTAVLSDTPVAYWRLNETTGATQFADATGNGRTATIVGTPTYSSATYADTASVGFSGTQYGTVSSGAWFASLSAYSVEAWFRTTGTGNKMIISYDNSGASPGTATRVFMFYVSGGNVMFTPLMSSGSYVSLATPTNTYNDGNWHHAVGVWDGSTAYIYIDGALSTSAALSGTTTNGGGQPILIGTGNNNAPGNYLQYSGGHIDEVALYNYALGSTAIGSHFATASPALAPSQAQIESQHIEVLAVGASALQIEAAYIEALSRGAISAQIESSYLETLVQGTQALQIQSSFLEVLVPVQTIKPFKGWGTPIRLN